MSYFHIVSSQAGLLDLQRKTYLLTLKNNMNMNEQKPVVVIGDVHGMRNWEKIVSTHPNCKYIILYIKFRMKKQELYY